jgi:type IV fimbrial biogenesis protein FimT
VRGFTLIELIVSLAVLTLVLSFGIPNLKGITENHYARNNLAVLYHTMRKARVLSLKRGQDILVCPLDGQICSSNWALPLSVFGDTNNNHQLDSGEVLYIQANNKLKHGYWQKKRSTQNYIKFNSLGHAFGSATTFLYCPSSNQEVYAKQLVINFQGRIRINTYLNDQGKAYPNIAPLACHTL